MLPELPQEVPLYAINRKDNESVYSYLQEIKKDFNLKGAILRRKENIYSIGNISTGNFFLHFDLYNHTFDIPKLNIPMKVQKNDDPLEVLRSVLKGKGLLQFEETARIYQFPDKEKTWVRFTPKLALPLISIEEKNISTRNVTDNNGNKFYFGQTGYVDVEVSEQDSEIIGLYHYFPNIREDQQVPLSQKENIITDVQNGIFLHGKTKLQYPGAVPLKERNTFYKTLQNDEVQISNATIEEVECGYFSQDTNKLQHFIVPSCIISGKGKVNDNSVLFDVVIPITK